MSKARTASKSSGREQVLVLPPEGRGIDANDWLDAYSTTVRLPDLKSGRVVFISDVHYPFHLKMHTEMAVRQIEEMKPDYVILGGDIFDFHSIASFGHDPSRRNALLQVEFDVGRPHIQRLCKAAKRSCHFILGNHCQRMTRALMLNPGMWGLRSLNMHQLAGLPEELNVYPYLTKLQVGRMNFHHGQIANQNVAKSTFQRFGKNMVVGHSHRPEVHYTRQADEDHVVLVSGTYQDPRKARYVDSPNWGFGHVVVDFETLGGESFFHARHALFHDNYLRFDGTFTKPTRSQLKLLGD